MVKKSGPHVKALLGKGPYTFPKGEDGGSKSHQSRIYGCITGGELRGNAKRTSKVSESSVLARSCPERCMQVNSLNPHEDHIVFMLQIDKEGHRPAVQ